MSTTAGPREVRAPRGTELTCKGWPQEAALRMLMNNLDPEVAERPDDLVVYGGTGRAARSWEAFDAIVRELRRLEGDETLLVQSGKPVGVVQTHEWAPARADREREPRPRVGHLGGVPQARGARAHDVRPDDRGLVDLHRHAGNPAGHLRDVRGDRRQAVRRHARGHDLAHGRPRRDGRRTAARGHDERRRGRCASRSTRRGSSGGSRRATSTCRSTTSTRRSGWRSMPATAGRRCRSACSATRPTSCRALAASGAPIDIVTDQTSAHDPLSVRPAGLSLEEAAELRACATPPSTRSARAPRWPRTCAAMVAFLDGGAEVFDYGNNLRAEAEHGGFERAFAYPGFIPAYIRPLFCEGKGPFRWAALSGDPADIAATDRAVLEEFPENERARALDPDGRRAGRLPGPARAHLLARVRRAAPRSGCGSTTWSLAASCRRRS